MVSQNKRSPATGGLSQLPGALQKPSFPPAAPLQVSLFASITWLVRLKQIKAKLARNAGLIIFMLVLILGIASDGVVIFSTCQCGRLCFCWQPISGICRDSTIVLFLKI